MGIALQARPGTHGPLLGNQMGRLCRPIAPFRIQLSLPSRPQADAHLSHTSEHLPFAAAKKQQGRASRPAGVSLAGSAADGNPCDGRP
jgi:hypothetical protein